MGLNFLELQRNQFETNDIANLNKICEVVQWYTELLDENSIIQKIILTMGRYLAKFGNDCDYPEEAQFCESYKMRNIPSQNGIEYVRSKK